MDIVDHSSEEEDGKAQSLTFLTQLSSFFQYYSAVLLNTTTTTLIKKLALNNVK